MVKPGLDPPPGEISNFNNQQSSVKTSALAVDILGIVCTTILFAVRMVARHIVHGKYGVDDFCCIIAYLGFLGYCTISIIMISHGGGIHQWNVPETEVIPFAQAVYATMVIYGPTVFATKASILFFLTRVFQPYERYCRLVYAFTFLMGCYYTLMLFLKIFICRPIHLFWDPSGDGQCFNQRALILSDNVISLISDIAVLLIPCPLAGGLKIALAAKLRIAAVFGAGGLACVCTFIRLIDIVKMGASLDQTYSFTLINLWGIAEVGIGLVCACFPVLPAFWKYLRKRHPSQAGTSYYARTGRSHDASRRRPSGGIELSKKSHHSRTTATEPRSSVSVGGGGTAHMYYSGSDENMLIPHGDMKVTTSVRGGATPSEDLEMGKESGGEEIGVARGAPVVTIEAGGRNDSGMGQKRSYEDDIVRTVEVQMMREPK